MVGSTEDTKNEGHPMDEKTLSTDNSPPNANDSELHQETAHEENGLEDASTEIDEKSATLQKSTEVQEGGEITADKVPDVEQPLEKSTTAASERPFSSFTLWEKRTIVAIASFGAFLSPLTTNIYFPALSTIAADLGVTVSKLNLTITTYMIFQGLAPSFIGSFADNAGRRPAYLIGFAIYITSNIGLALNNSYVGLMVLRCVQSCGSSGMVTLYTAVVADVVTSAERGSYIAFTSIGSILGPSVSPIIGGLLSQHLGWHSIFWFLVIFSGVFSIFMIAFYPETGRGIVGDGSVPPSSWNKSLISIHKDRQRKKRGETLDMHRELAIEKMHNGNPASRTPSPRFACFGGLIYAMWYVLSTTVTTQFHAIYHLNDTDLGLIFLPLAVGSICAAVTNGNLLDRNYRRHAKKAGMPLKKSKQIDMSHFNIERVRLEIGLPFLSAGALFFIAYGWLLDYEVHIAGPLVILTFLGYCCFAGFNTLTVLVIDTHRSNPATASAAANLVRCLLGAGAAAVANPAIDAIGRGWTFTFIGLVMLSMMPVLLAVMKWGPEWRREETRKLEARRKRRVKKTEGKETAK